MYHSWCLSDQRKVHNLPAIIAKLNSLSSTSDSPCTAWRSVLWERLLVVSYVLWHHPIAWGHAHLIHHELIGHECPCSTVKKYFKVYFFVGMKKGQNGRAVSSRSDVWIELQRKFKENNFQSDDNLMRAIWNGIIINYHRDVDCKFFAVKFSQIVETLLLRIVI